MLVTQLCLTLCDLMDCSPPDSSIYGILQARTGVGCHVLLPSSQPRDQTQVPCIAGRFFTIWGTQEAPPPTMDIALQIFFTANLILEKRKTLSLFPGDPVGKDPENCQLYLFTQHCLGLSKEPQVGHFRAYFL